MFDSIDKVYYVVKIELIFTYYTNSYRQSVLLINTLNIHQAFY